MKAKFSALVSEFSGKLNGSVAVRGKSTAYFRNRVMPINPNTNAQQFVRQRFSIVSKAWSSLTQTQILAWNSAVANWKYSNLFADIKELSGKALYQKLNQNLITSNLSIINDPPTKVPFPTIEFGFINALVVPNISFNSEIIINTDSGEYDGCIIIVEATAPLSAGTTNAGSKFRVITELGSSNYSIGDNFNIAPAYIAKFGLPTVKTKIFVRIKLINETTGETTTYSLASKVTEEI